MLVVLKLLLLVVGILVSLVVFIYNWRRRWLYYYSSKIPGPIALPLFGSIQRFKGPHSTYKFLKKLLDDYPSVVRIWLGPQLYVSTTDTNHLKFLLNKFLEKGRFYELMFDYFRWGLAAAPVDMWKKNRKHIAPTFNTVLINTFVDTFGKHSNYLVQYFEDKCGRETEDIFPKVFQATVGVGCEALADIDPEVIKIQDYLPGYFRVEEILLQRFFHPLFHFNIFWKFSQLRKELISIWKKNCSCIKKILDLKNMYPDDESNKSPMKKFLNHFVDLYRNDEISYNYLIEESQTMFFVGNESSAVAISSTLVVLGIYPEVQEKLSEELEKIFGNSDRNPTLEDVNQMDYLERVIKETMRLIPPFPFVMRLIDEHIKIDSYTFPAGAQLIIPIVAVHRKPEFWPEPLKFDPDRFLPEEVAKRPSCAYIPFSYGVRNCLGYKYGMLSMKIFLSTFLRRYKIKSSNYKSIEDIEPVMHILAKAKDGYKVLLEKRNHFL